MFRIAMYVSGVAVGLVGLMAWREHVRATRRVPAKEAAELLRAAWADHPPGQLQPIGGERFPKNLSKYRVQGEPVEVLWSPVHSQRTRMDGARNVFTWLEVGKSQFLDRF